MTGSQKYDATTRQQALDWFTRLRAADVTVQERDAFETWRLQAQNAHAYAEVERMWQCLELPARRVRKAQRTLKAKGLRLGAAACLLLALGTLILARPELVNLGADIATAAGERREIQLGDGSRLLLDSGSDVDVDMAGATRSVRLRRGRLFADVVHDGRPFVVHVGNAKVEVLGTRFSVSRAGDEEEVILLSGHVQVSTPTQQRRLTSGQRLTLRGAEVTGPQAVDAERLLAWRTGQLRVRDVSLQQVLQQLAAYQGKQLVLMNDQAGQRRVSGSFNLDEPDTALDALVASQQLQISKLLGHWLIIR
ncbi:FecR domain-containing protein [Pseudomonas fulva]|uniref:FecR family protein n=1 Tax=Pseudomonas fulva TaxID=47880 RepID=UPI0018AA2F85|nr:FecR domain-containing protein [Pseudomonas fulva]MBF8676708.1 FecR domain-containing protein [Pseudomonas fulva]MBF8696757.1 FecR domain-containing protein [Pseudomonas fulva]